MLKIEKLWYHTEKSWERIQCIIWYDNYIFHVTYYCINNWLNNNDLIEVEKSIILILVNFDIGSTGTVFDRTSLKLLVLSPGISENQLLLQLYRIAMCIRVVKVLFPFLLMFILFFILALIKNNKPNHI